MRDDIEDIERKLLDSLRRTGERYFLYWPLVVASSWAAEKYQEQWIQIIATLNLVAAMILISIPNIGRIAALNKYSYGLSKSIKTHLTLAYIGAALLTISMASIWLNQNISWILCLIAYAIAFLNSINSSKR